jgi:DNA-damage-inducible protein D
VSQPQTLNFDTIRQTGEKGQEYWSARDLAPLLGYKRWENFEVAIKRAMTACQQVEQIVSDHFRGTTKMIQTGKGAQRGVKEFYLSRFACYLVAQNGDPAKPEIAAAQSYFAISTRENELRELFEEQARRVLLREQIAEDNEDLKVVAYQAGVLPTNWGRFQEAGIRGLYGDLGTAQVKERKGISAKEDLLDRAGSTELAANAFRITQTRDKLRRDAVAGQAAATETHYSVGKTVRAAIEEIGGTMPEDLPPGSNIRPALAEKKRRAKLAKAGDE